MKSLLHIRTKNILRPNKTFVLILIILSINLHGQTLTQTYTANDTFTVPQGVTSITVQCWGGGGRGADTTSNPGVGRGGGGGGAYASSVLTVIPGASYTITIGAGGNDTTVNGGNSSFGANLVMAQGGRGVANNTTTAGLGGQLSASVGTIRYNGGNGANGNGAIGGGGGGGAGSTGNGNNASGASAGAARATNGGSGGNGGTAINVIAWVGANGNPGNNYGGGGGGSARGALVNFSGGDGAQGLVIVSYQGLPTPCAASSSSGTFFINSVSVNGVVTDFANNGTGYTSGGYANYSGTHIAEQIPGGGLNISVVLGGGTQHLSAWIDWNQDGDFVDAGENIYSSGTTSFSSTDFGVVVPLGTLPGLYKIRIRSRQGDSVTSPCGSYSNGETEDYMLRVVPDCAAHIVNVMNGSRCGTGTVALQATGSPGVTGFRWYSDEVGGVLLGTTATGNWSTPVISETTTYYVAAMNPTCESYYRERIDAVVYSSTEVVVSPEEPLICKEGDIVEITVESYLSTEELINEDFEGSFPGSFTVNTIANTSSLGIVWGQRTSTYATTTNVWKPAISSGRIGNRFAFTSSDVPSTNMNTALQLTNSVSTADFTELTLTFRHYYSDYSPGGDYAYLEISTNGGTSWQVINTFNSDQGIPTRFKKETINMSSYVGFSNFKIRFRYESLYADGWAIDDIKLYGKKSMSVPIEWINTSNMLYIDSNASIPYNGENIPTVYAKPDEANLEDESWIFTVESSLLNGCVVQKDILVTNNSRTWVGNTTQWNLSSNWRPGTVPTIENCVIVPDITNQPLISQSDAYAKNILVKSGAIINVNSDLAVYVKEEVHIENNADFIFENNSSLVQIDNVLNTGNITYNRTTSPMNLHDYTYWGSPVSGQITSNLFQNPNNIFKWNPVSQSWASAHGEAMSVGYGYIMRAPADFPSPGELKQPLESTFTGIPNNGNINVDVMPDPNALSSDPYINAVMSFLSNPYPSAINIDEFFIDAQNSSKIIPTVYLWTHSTDPVLNNAGTAFVYVSNDFAVYNLLGGVNTQAAPNDDLNRVPTGKIASGQGFFIKGSTTGGTVTFKNSYRTDNTGTAYDNSEFYRVNNTASENYDKHRIWLSIRSEEFYKQTLIGYTFGASNGLDMLDGDFYDGGNYVSLYSLLDNQKALAIQGREMPFEDTDQVPLGFKLYVSGNFRIHLDFFDGLFSESDENQGIYLKDNFLDIIHNLKESPYEFYSETGEFNNRFTVVYRESLNKVENHLYNDWFVYSKDDKLQIGSKGFIIKDIAVYDLLGRVIYQKENIYSDNYTVDEIYANTIYIVKVTSTENKTSTKKVYN